MRILVDAHIFLWFAAGDTGRLGPKALTLMQRPDADLLLSVASVWELSIKYALGQLSLPVPPEGFFPAELRRGRHTLLPIEPGHVYTMARLPLHHRDPFDRMLVGRAIVEGLPLLTHDSRLPVYAALGATVISA